jgi:hypothetical protein
LLWDGWDDADPRIAAFSQFLEDDIRLLAEIDLETYMVDDVVLAALTCLATANRNDSYEITECTGIASIVDDADLALFICSEHFSHVFYPFAIGIDALIATTNTDRGRSLEEAAVATENLVLGIACKAAEGGGAVYDGMVVPANVNDDERASEVYRSKGNAGIWTGSNASENGEEIKARGRVDRKTESRGGGDSGGGVGERVDDWGRKDIEIEWLCETV